MRNVSRKLLNGSRNLIPKQLNFHNNQKALEEIQVIIIGAGLAGLSAANHLLSHGFKRTIILEATERYGGRVKSIKFGDTFCELGAKWVTINASKNSMYELVKRATGLPNKIQNRNTLHFVDTSGVRINRKLPELIDILFKRLVLGTELSEKYKNGNLHDLNNVHTYFQSETTKMIGAMFKHRERELANDIFDSLFKEFSSLLGCCLEYVNIKHIANAINPSNPIYVPTGLDCILRDMTVDITYENMKTGKPVGEINWSTNKQGSKFVGCLDGTIFHADHIICTLPLGVLKNFSTYMFKPSLPKEKQRAIQNLGFGSPVKLYLEYEEDVKPWFALNFRPLWSRLERKADLKWTKQVVEVSKLPSSSRVLEILIGGAFYYEIEVLPDTEVIQEVTKLLRTCLKNKKIPYPKSLLRSNWSSSACYLGGRPYFAISSSINDVTTLAAPLGETPNLLFAGDATILNGFGTLDGARMSGIREAERIIKYYNRYGPGISG